MYRNEVVSWSGVNVALLHVALVQGRRRVEELGYSQLEEGLTGYGRESLDFNLRATHENFQCRSNGREIFFF